jgi:hypothetical protein
MFSDVRAFRRDPLNFLLARGNSAALGLERLHLGPSPVFLVTDPDLIRPILKAPETEIGKGRLIKKLTPVFGRSSLMLHGDEHKRRRAVLHKHMAKGSVERFLQTPRGDPRGRCPSGASWIVRSPRLHGSACASHDLYCSVRDAGDFGGRRGRASGGGWHDRG